MKQAILSMVLLLLTCTINAQPVNNLDSTLVVFNDPSYKLSLHIFDPGSENEEDMNATLTLDQMINGHGKILRRDSLHCKFLKMELKDFNMDGTKDILILHTSGARSNQHFYLFLVNQEKHTLTPVKGFTDLHNPEINKKNGVITSMALYGHTQSFSYYKITPEAVLKKHGKSKEVQVK